MSFDRELLLRTFIAEAEEHLDTIEALLLELEQHPGDDTRLGTVFRLMHTLKGNAGLVGYPSMVDFVHQAEGVLARLRERTLPVVEEAVDLLLQAVDALRHHLPGVRGASLEAPPSLLALGDQLASLAGSAAPGGERVPAGALPAAEGPDPAALPRRRTLRVDLDALDRLFTMTGELAVARGRLTAALEDPAPRLAARALEVQRESDRLLLELQELVMRLRLVALGPTLRLQDRTLRDATGRTGRSARLLIEGEGVQLDTSLVELLKDPLTHLVRNAVAHGIEAPEERLAAGKPAEGTVTLRARQEVQAVILSVSDDGRGLDLEAIAQSARRRGVGDVDQLSARELERLVFEPGISTAAQVDEVSGRGVGLDVVRRNVEAMRGTVSVTGARGQGTTFTLRLPLSLTIIQGFSVTVGDDAFVVPMEDVVECITLGDDDFDARERGVTNLRGEPLPWVELRRLFGLGERRAGRRGAVVVRHEHGLAALVVDQLVGEIQAVFKPMGKVLSRIPAVTGTTILDNGRVALVLDIPGLLARVLTRNAPTPSSFSLSPPGASP